jgi:DNA-binding response OmpR family regulator
MDDNTAAHTTPESGNQRLLGKETGPEQAISPQPMQQYSEEEPPSQLILLVEDDPTLATLEAEILAAQGYRVVIVHSGELAIATFRRSIPDLVVLDLELIGGVQGWDVLQELRAHASIPVLITSSSAATARKYMRSSGEKRLTLDHLPKPYTMHMLLKRVKRMLPIPH